MKDACCKEVGVYLKKITRNLKATLAICLFVSAPASAQDVNGYWLFYDVALKEKFELVLYVKSYKSFGELSYQTYGARSLQRSATGPKLQYRVREGTVNFVNSDTGDLFMSGTLNADATEMTGTFYTGRGAFQRADGTFVAQKQKTGERSPIYQVIYLGGRYKSAPNCVAYGDKENAYSISAMCKATQGKSRVLPTRTRGAPANWLAQPNTFLSEQACFEKLEEIKSASLCSKLCSTPLCLD